MSARVEGNFDLDATLTLDTRLVDLNGAGGFGVRLGEISVDVGGTLSRLDLSTAHTVGDIVTMLETEIQLTDAGATVAISAAGDAIEITPSAGPNDVFITDLTAGTTAADLGLNLVGGFLNGVTTAGNDVDPRITEHTLTSNLPGLTQPLGTIRVGNAGQVRDLDLSGVTNVQELMNAVQGLGLGVRVEIADNGDRLNFINELSGGQMSIAEVAGGVTATELGVRTLASWTRLEDFNNGLGIQIKTGSVDPVTGLPDPASDLDFRISMKDSSVLDVDLAGAETVQDVLDAINDAAAIAVAPVVAALASDGNGITITDGTVGVGATSVTAMNGSFAGEDLGLIGTTGGASLTSEDRATVAVESVFTHLIRLRDALLTNDERGITLAADKFDADISRVTEARADTGIRSRRVAAATNREEDRRIQDMSLRSLVQDLDYTEASLRFAALQQQLQAGLLVAQRVNSLSLLDFLR
jgi:flagellin-like hook-associated protein FlgL